MDRSVPLPPLPARISRLDELACDLWFSARRVVKATAERLYNPALRHV